MGEIKAWCQPTVNVEPTHLDSKPNIDSISSLLPDIASDPRLWPHRLDLVNGRALLLRMDEKDFERATFLDERLLGQPRDGNWLNMPELARLMGEDGLTGPCRYIFHIGHCGSTLLSRLLGALSGTLSLREPQVLRTLATARRDLHKNIALISSEHWHRLHLLLNRMLSRGFHPQQQVVVKATSECTNLLQDTLRLDADSGAVLLYVDLQSYLASVLRFEESRRELRALAAGKLTDLNALVRLDEIILHQLDDSRKAVVNWLAGMVYFLRTMSTTNDQNRVLMIRFDDLLTYPNRALKQCAECLNLLTDDAEIDQIVSGSILSQHAKLPGHPYTPTD